MPFHVAVDALIALVNAAYCRAPSIVRAGSFRAARHAGGTGFFRAGARLENASRTACGAVGARSPLHTLAAFPLRNERSSRKNSSRFLPQRTVRYRPRVDEYITGE